MSATQLGASSTNLSAGNSPETYCGRRNPSKAHRRPTTAQAAGIHSCDVAIVGGGLGGLVSAAAIRRTSPHLDVKVFEQSPNFAKAGALLGLAVNSQKALAAIDPSLMQQVEAVAVSPGRSLTFSHTGELLREGTTAAAMKPDGKDEMMVNYGRSIMRLGWWELHQILAAAQPEGSVVFDSKFAGYEECGDRIVVRFQKGGADGGAEGASEWEAGLVVGADGAFSAVRRQCLDDGKPGFAGTVIWRARLATAGMSGLLDDGVIERSWFGDERYANLWLVNEQQREGCWVFGTNEAVLKGMGVDFSLAPGAKVGYQTQPVGRTAYERIRRVAEGYPPDFQRVLDGTDPESVVEHGMLTRGTTGPWGRGRVTLCGDSAHPMRPATGQGFGQAAEDAHALATAVREHGPVPEALRAFESMRWERVSRIGEIEQALAEAAYSKQGGDMRQKQSTILNTNNYQDLCFGPDFAPLQA